METMLQQYKMVSIIYGGSGAKYAEELNHLIQTQSGKHRYPISSTIVMDSILTGDLLTNVVNLFAGSEVCVVFLTAEDCCITKGQERLRLRQNVVFELGMAIFRLGRDRCILLSDFDPADPRIELPSDLNGVDIKHFTPGNQEQVFHAVLDKILQLSRSSVRSRRELEKTPQYDHLLDRTDYYVDYEALFAGSEQLQATEGAAYLRGVLQLWENECRSFRHFEERCIYFFERIGLLSVFGRHSWVCDWCEACEEMLSRFSQSDIEYCGIRRLKFIRNLASAVSVYTRIKMNPEKEPEMEAYEDLLNQLLMEPFDRSGVVNPLVATVYYDYLGLVYLRLFGFTGRKDQLLQAAECFARIMDQYVDLVDMNLGIWTGFVAYNLARCYARLFTITADQADAQKALQLLNRASFVRKKWLAVSDMNLTIRSALSYEYFICKIEQINAMATFGTRSNDALRQEYDRLRGELEAYLNKDEQLERLRFVQRLIGQKQTALN